MQTDVLIKRMAVLLPIAWFVFFAVAYTQRLGLTYDETHFVNAALGGITGDLIYYKINGIPLMILPYAGALKSYVYYPVFKLFGVNAYSVRLPAILLSVLTLIIWYKNAVLFTNNKLFSVLFLWLLATDIFFIVHSRLDIGPTVLQNVFIAAAMYYYLIYKNTGRTLSLCALLLCCFLGEFNKLNFIWFIAAMALSAALFNREDIIYHFKNNIAQIGVLILFIVIQSVIGVILIKPLITDFPIGEWMMVDWMSRCIHLAQVYWLSFTGIYMYVVVFMQKPACWSLAPMIEMTAIIVWFSAVVTMRIRQSRQIFIVSEKIKPIVFLMGIFMIESVLMTITPQARVSEHVMVLWPLMHLIFICIAVYCCTICADKRVISVLAGLVVLLVLSQSGTDIYFLNSLRHPPKIVNKLYSPAVNRLTDYINQHRQELDVILAADFGLNNQLLALAPDNEHRRHYHDIWFYFIDDPQLMTSRNTMYPALAHGENENWQSLYEMYFSGKTALIVVYQPQIIGGVLDRVYQFAETYSLDMQYVTSIHDDDNNPVYALYLVRPRHAEGAMRPPSTH